MSSPMLNAGVGLDPDTKLSPMLNAGVGLDPDTKSSPMLNAAINKGLLISSNVRNLV